MLDLKIVSVAGICIVSAVMCKLFANDNKEYGLFIKIAASSVIMSMIIIFVSPVTETIHNIYNKAGADEEYLTILFKSLGICRKGIAANNSFAAFQLTGGYCGKSCLILIHDLIVQNGNELG